MKQAGASEESGSQESCMSAQKATPTSGHRELSKHKSKKPENMTQTP